MRIDRTTARPPRVLQRLVSMQADVYVIVRYPVPQRRIVRIAVGRVVMP
jgi:hypothetical protein